MSSVFAVLVCATANIAAAITNKSTIADRILASFGEWARAEARDYIFGTDAVFWDRRGFRNVVAGFSPRSVTARANDSHELIIGSRSTVNRNMLGNIQLEPLDAS